MIEKDEYIKCKIRIKTIFYPKDLGTHEPGDFASFSAVIIEVKEGNPKTKHGYLILKGPVHELNYSTEFVVTGRYTPHPQYGAQYTIVYMNKVINLQDPVEQRMFLEHILTENQVNLLYENLKNPFEVIKNRDAYTLCTVSGIGEKTANTIIKKYYDDIDNSAAYVALDSYGLSGKIIDKLVERYHGADIAVEKIRENPYALVEDISGIGWKRADDIALNAGEDPQGVNRIKAYIINYLREEAENGNTWTNVDDVASACIDELRLTSPDNLRKAINLLGEEKKIWWDENKTVLALARVIKLERNIANELMRLLNGSNEEFEKAYGDIDQAIKEAEEKIGFEYTQEQKDAIRMIATNNVSIVTGGAGCLDGEMEFFNGKQWKKIRDYNKEDMVLQYNEDGTATLVYPERYVKYPCDKMYHLNNLSNSIDQIISEEHTVISLSSKGNLVKTPAYEVYKRDKNSVNGFANSFITSFNFSGPGIDLTDEEIRLMCAVICDGNFITATNWCRINVKKERKKERIRKLLNQCKINFKETHWNKKDPEYSNFSFYAPRREKIFTSYWYDCSHHQLEVICDEILFWDGHVKEGRRKSFSTLVKQTADFVQFAFTSCGYRTVIQSYKRNRNGKIRIEYMVNIVQHKERQTSLAYKGRSGRKKDNIEIIQPSDGYKYCFTVPSSMFIVRYNDRICVTGNTGKSSSVAAVLDVLKGFKFAQTALSGRAASRLSEVTGVEGFTIHRLLGYDGVEGKFAHNKENTLPYSIIILDETSMVGAQLFYDLIQAIRTGAKLIMIGDDGQLESIGLCNVFKDMLNSGVVPTTRLTKIHRQAAKSAIITNSIKVRNGQQIIPQGWEGKEVRGELKDLELDIYSTGKDSQNHLLTQFRTLYNSLGRIDDIQIILPQKTRGEICTYKINDIVQSIVNPRGRNSVVIRSPEAGANYILRENDRVIVNKNNYETKTPEGKNCAIFNGNRGIIKKINKSKEKMIITFEQWGDIVIKKEDWNTIELGYALTCHKLQGSEANYVIIGMDYGARIMLTREWVYTAITRAKKKCILCAESGALSYAVANSRIPFKRTLLREFLCEQSINNKE